MHYAKDSELAVNATAFSPVAHQQSTSIATASNATGPFTPASSTTLHHTFFKTAFLALTLTITA